MIDSHAHLFFDRFDADRDAVIARARSTGVDTIINVGIDVPTSQACVELAAHHAGLHATIGLHPTSRGDDLDGALEALRALARDARAHIVAVGEIGLDYYWKDVPHAVQRPRFIEQLALARELDLPIVIHCRDALEDIFALLEAETALPPGVFHCFSGGADDARRAEALGFHVSFAGNVTFPKATLLQEAARAVRPDRLLLETDCPFLAPQPRRGKRNEPAFLTYSRDFLADLTGIAPDELERITTRNAVRLFGLPTPGPE